MPISFECSDCSTALKVKEQLAGRKIRCPKCDAVNQVPEGNGESDDDEPVSRSRSSSSSSRSDQSRRNPARRSAKKDDDDFGDLPQLTRKKKKGSKKSEPESSGGVPVWAIVAGSSLFGVVAIAAIVFIAMKPNSQATNGVAGADAAKPAAVEKPKVVVGQIDGQGANFRMKWEMPLNWTSEGSIERNRWPWATMKGQGQVIKLTTNRSLVGGAETMTTKGGAVEQLKTSHTLRGGKLQAENTDWVDSQLNVHQGKGGTVIWSDYEYKGVIGKGYGIRCTVSGPTMPCTLMMECSQSARDKWRPTLLAIAESIHLVKIKPNGQEDTGGFDFGPDDDKPEAADQAEMDSNADDKE